MAVKPRLSFTRQSVHKTICSQPSSELVVQQNLRDREKNATRSTTLVAGRDQSGASWKVPRFSAVFAF
jgi:hypothetical protein